LSDYCLNLPARGRCLRRLSTIVDLKLLQWLVLCMLLEARNRWLRCRSPRLQHNLSITELTSLWGLYTAESRTEVGYRLDWGRRLGREQLFLAAMQHRPASKHARSRASAILYARARGAAHCKHRRETLYGSGRVIFIRKRTDLR